MFWMHLFDLHLRSSYLPGKPLTRVSKPAPGVHAKRGLERGWQKRLAKGWRKVGEGLAKGPAKGWRRVGKGWRVSLRPATL